MVLNSREVQGKVVMEVDVKDLDSSVATEFKNLLIENFEKHADSILVLDVSKVRFFDSTCLGALLAAFRQTGSKQKMVITGAQASVMHVLTVARLVKLFPIAESTAEALQMTPTSWAS